MHLLFRDTRSLDEAAPAVDLAHAPGDLLLLSFSDADLAGLAAAHAAGPTLRLAPLGQLRHPLSVDLYLDQTARHARCIVVRLLGGLDYWRYGAEELASLCHARAIPLAILPGEARDDPALAALSTVSPADYARLDACFRHGGRSNMARAIGLMGFLGGLSPDVVDPAQPMPQHGVHALDLDDRPLAAIVFYRSHLLSDDIAPITALTQALRDRGLAVGAIYAGSLKSPETAAFVAGTLAAWRPSLVLNATGFSSRVSAADGGTEHSPLDAADAAVLQLVLAGTDRNAWLASSRGLSPADLAMQVVLPELDGRLLATAISFKTSRDGRAVHAPDLDGITLAADRAAGWARLRATSAAQRRVAIVLSDYPGAGGQRGHAVGLDGFASLAAVASLLTGAGYAASPTTAAMAVDALCRDAPVPFLSLDDYRRLLSTLPNAAAITAAWGDPADDPCIEAGQFTLPLLRLGNVFAVIQPDRGSSGDRRAAYHDPDLPPRHGFAAFYLWLQTAVDALVHLGTHGSLEWLPGKAAALSAACWPSALIGGLPVIYPFIVNNPGEAAAAKRRLGAVAIGHLTPPLRQAGAHGDAARLERLIDEYAAADGMDRRRSALLRSQILDHAASNGLLQGERAAPGTPDDDALARLDAYLCDVKELQIRDGLHIYGTQPDPERLALLPAGAELCAAAERSALLAALDGRFVQPGPAGAPSSGRTDVLPTGRTWPAWTRAPCPPDPRSPWPSAPPPTCCAATGRTRGDWPRAIVLNVWGAAAMRTGGQDIALALLLLGVRPVWDDGSARVNGFVITPLAELDRPRVDVTLRISGLFRDAFAAQVTLFDAAAAAVADRDEAPGWNPLAGHPVRACSGRNWANTAPGRTGWRRRSPVSARRLTALPTPPLWPPASAAPTPCCTCRTTPRPTCWTVRSTPPTWAASRQPRLRWTRRLRSIITMAASAPWPSRSPASFAVAPRTRSGSPA